MSVAGQVTLQQLQQDLQNELTTSNQLLRQISMELQQIKQLTSSGGELEAQIIQNASLLSTLANMQQIDTTNLPRVQRKNIDLNINHTMQNVSYEQHDSFRNASDMDDSQ
ncbi:uncharacterized protein LOC114354489 [Ostrinia furnacalis]|uniref:uncharacterized protein LOC114354489 n=1 Tax=Ostrinia furnacalis TaxID=93504 RepID=UPI00103F6119|nr:uncharacterized protein LOC114354489 [Ostrinia furnacalis]